MQNRNDSDFTQLQKANWISAFLLRQGYEERAAGMTLEKLRVLSLTSTQSGLSRE